MTIFKTAVQLLIRHKVYFIVYVMAVGAVGLFMVVGQTATPGAGDLNRVVPTVGVIDRDQSQLSTALTAFLADQATLVTLDDSRAALQQAAEQNNPTYSAIIPAGFEADFLAAVTSGAGLPVIETVSSYNVTEAYMADELVNGFLSAVQAAAVAQPGAPLATLLDQAAAAAGRTTDATVVSLGAAESGERVGSLLLWCTYALTAGVGTLVGLIAAGFRRGELGQRNLVAPVRPRTMSLQVAAGCAVAAVATTAWIVLLMCLPPIGGLDLLAETPGVFGLLVVDVLVYSLVCTAFGFLLAQTGWGLAGINGAANIVGLGCYFLGGVGLQLTSSLSTVAHFLPTYWYGDGLMALTEASALTGGVLGRYGRDLAIQCLFAAALAAVGLVVGRVRRTSASEAGNAAVMEAELA
ncbi:MAG: ABC transporter permease [Propionibacteriaceae bacterium]|jgi:ABC-2 type transport system permease protein|nr:ABC transporter permease [Propionibacteriaceae bacterium]